ncbi:MAG: short chain enoyl-CoA hydratase [Mycobacterium sp.]|nr:short chain enoyl-CoA hydratase [Mycobacterium sp.]
MAATRRSDEYQHIRLERPAEHVARVVLDRPRSANALSSALLVELADAVARIALDDDVRVWLLTGANRADGRPWFSAGVDLKEALAASSSTLDGGALVDSIDDMLKPSIAVIGGVCTTGALELALACDLRVAARSATLSDWHLKRTGLGIGAWGMAARLSRLVGVDKAKEILLLGEELTGDQAAAIGLVNRVVPDDQLDSEGLRMATIIAALPRRGVRTTLGYLALQSQMSKEEALRWANLTPELMGVKLRPFSDAANRFNDEREGSAEHPAPEADA